MADQLWLIIPVKMLALGKQRLSGVLRDSQRRELAEAMLKDMLLTLKTVPGIDKIVLVSKDQAVFDLATQMDVAILAEPTTCQGLNEAVQFALTQATAENVEKALILHGDIPHILAQDISTLIAKSRMEVSLVPDAHDNGTNAMLLTLPTRLEPHYGEGSFAQHLSIAEAQGISCQIIRSTQSLQHDIDQVSDLITLQQSMDKNSFTSQLVTSEIWQETLHLAV